MTALTALIISTIPTAKSQPIFPTSTETACTISATSRSCKESYWHKKTALTIVGAVNWFLGIGWIFGRRPILLHLSGFPCQYRRRVVGTKSTTSNIHLYPTIIIHDLFLFVKNFFISDDSIPFSFSGLLKSNNRIFIIVRISTCFQTHYQS